MHKYMPSLEGENLVIGVARARFQEELGDELYNACIQELLSLGVKKQNIYAITVPGSLQVSLELNLAIGNAILTVENEQQAKERVQEKGKAVSATVVEMANYRRILKSSFAKKY